ncbi:Retrovirus-related Pol polyprotein from type-1 retrotransposable element R1 4 [Sarcoptes scabiei]|uniref:Retrovirus-related Pol polyprotein from type-1 retrotransposable element R1 4 n=1 Tax=Sarcoptes scabiei TaxID=52283 RepID=A0A834V9A9_SARSC|nr:Retrovirus-related Pol polyprotein from type-1 retrotransposable element R1 4 [Sarcoptes scabiei]
MNFHKKSFNHPIIIDSNIIEFVNNIKILGIVFENHFSKSKINFTTHIKNVINKTTKIKNIMFNYCRNTFGIDNKKRMVLFKGLIRPILTYGSEIWSDHINKKQKNNLESLQHQFLKNSIMGFKTISKTCAQSLTKTLLLQTHIDIKGMKFFHNNHIQRIDTNDLKAYIQDFKRTKLIENFALTNQNFQSFFVHNFIPKFVRTSFYTTQFFTGHGPFAEYLHRLRIINHNSCSCDSSSIQNPSHLLLNCPHYALIKTELNFNHITDLSSFVASKDNFKRFKKLCKYIHDHLRSLESSNRHPHHNNSR